MKPMPCSVQWSSSSSASRLARLKRFCTDTISAVFCASTSWSTVDLGEADVPDLALVLELLELADLVGDRVVGVDPVQLEQVDPLEAEPAQAQLDLLAQVRRLAERQSTLPGPWRVSPALVAITTSSA